MRFAEIPGLQEEKSLLINAVKNNHVAHAQLFFGAEGTGNLALALAFISYLNCLNRQERDSCGECSNCTKIDKLVHPDINFVFPVVSTKKFSGKDAVSSNHLPSWREQILSNPYTSLNDWYEKLDAENKQGNISKEESRHIVKALSLKAFEAEYKVMLIWLPELMHVTAANGILKILEEPPNKTIFLLVSNDYEKLLSTILSRTQLFKIKPFLDDELTTILSGLNMTHSDHGQAIRLASGSVSKAIQIIQNKEHESEANFINWMRSCWKNDFSHLVALADEFAGSSKVKQKSLLNQGLNVLQSGLKTVFGGNDDESELSFADKFVKALNLNSMEQISQALNEALYHLERNANPKILFLSLSMDIGSLLKS